MGPEGSPVAAAILGGGQGVCSRGCAEGPSALPDPLLSSCKPTSAASTPEAPGTLMSFHIQSRSNC